jgi:hypothetical protein
MKSSAPSGGRFFRRTRRQHNNLIGLAWVYNEYGVATFCGDASTKMAGLPSVTERLGLLGNPAAYPSRPRAAGQLDPATARALRVAELRGRGRAMAPAARRQPVPTDAPGKRLRVFGPEAPVIRPCGASSIAHLTSGRPAPHRLLQRLQELNRARGIDSASACAARRYGWIT